MSTASAHMTAIRCWLDMPSNDEKLWSRMTSEQRRALLMLAGLPRDWFSRKWHSITQIERMKIITQVHIVSKWAQQLQRVK